MSLQTQIDTDIKAAMLAKESAKLTGLRAIKAAILLAKTEKGAADELTGDGEIKVLQKLAKQRRESADIYQAQHRPDLYEIEVKELEVIESYLPQQLGRDEIAAIIQQIIADTGAAGIKDMGKVMGAANKELAGRADGKTISAIVKERLA